MIKNQYLLPNKIMVPKKNLLNPFLITKFWAGLLERKLIGLMDEYVKGYWRGDKNTPTSNKKNDSTWITTTSITTPPEYWLYIIIMKVGNKLMLDVNSVSRLISQTFYLVFTKIQSKLIENRKLLLKKKMHIHVCAALELRVRVTGISTREVILLDNHATLSYAQHHTNTKIYWQHKWVRWFIKGMKELKLKQESKKKWSNSNCTLLLLLLLLFLLLLIYLLLATDNNTCF